MLLRDLFMAFFLYGSARAHRVAQSPSWGGVLTPKSAASMESMATLLKLRGIGEKQSGGADYKLVKLVLISVS
jgi:hypothetical protein